MLALTYLSEQRTIKYEDENKWPKNTNKKEKSVQKNLELQAFYHPGRMRVSCSSDTSQKCAHKSSNS